jgi:hypothetical protein
MNCPTRRPVPSDLANAAWFKATASSSSGGCLEAAFLEDGYVALRDNEDTGNPPFVVTRHVWECFLDGAKKGEFDAPTAARESARLQSAEERVGTAGEAVWLLGGGLLVSAALGQAGTEEEGADGEPQREPAGGGAQVAGCGH